MFVKPVEHAVERGFKLDSNHIKHYMGEIANDGRTTYKNILPCGNTVRSFQAENREITIRKSENHSHKCILEENINQVGTLVNHLKDLKEQHPHLFKDSNYIWNLHETEVNAIYWKRVIRKRKEEHEREASQLQNLRSSYYGSNSWICIGYDSTTLVLAAGKSVMLAWTKPLDALHARNPFFHFNGWETKTKFKKK